MRFAALYLSHYAAFVTANARVEQDVAKYAHINGIRRESIEKKHVCGNFSHGRMDSIP